MPHHRGFPRIQPLLIIAFAGVVIAMLPSSSHAQGANGVNSHSHHESLDRADPNAASLPVPPEGKIPVAFVIGKNAEVLDFCGPLEVFAHASTKDGKPLFAPYLVAATLDPLKVSGGMKVVPEYTFKTAPQPKLIVIPAMAMDAATPEMIEWIRNASKSTDVIMSVCNGAFVLAKTGVLAGKQATAHHGGYFRFAGLYPDVRLKRGARFVEDGNIASAGGVSSGIDLALRVVERYVGREIATNVANVIEYQGNGWLNPDSNAAYATLPVLDGDHPLCPLCLMDGDRSIKTNYKGKTYYFCSESEKAFFEKHPDVFERFLAEDAALRGGSKKSTRVDPDGAKK